MYTAWSHIHCSQVDIVCFSGKVANPFNSYTRGAMNSNKGCDSYRVRAGEDKTFCTENVTNRESYISVADVLQLRALLQLTCCGLSGKQQGNRRCYCV
jgi:hypothetical protein